MKYVSDTRQADPFALSDAAFKVLHAMRKLGGRPTLDSLAALTNKSEPTLYRLFAELVRADFPVVLSPANGGGSRRKGRRDGAL